MASKFQMITGLYKNTIEKVTKAPSQWTAFLRSACRNYKCRFDEQILIYAQRPDATAVLEVNKWNEQFGRWVNKGARGIAVFNDEHNGNYRLKHYFDISDTHQSRFARAVPMWDMKSEYEAEVVESLENSFGDLEDNSTFASSLISVAKNAVEDNMADYFQDLLSCRENSFLEELDEFNVEAEYRKSLEFSVAYMLLTRCGINADEYIESEDFQFLWSFNTVNTVNALGLATSDIAEMCLRDIAITINSIQRMQGKREQNRTFAISENSTHNIEETQIDERGADHEQSQREEQSQHRERNSNISERGRLSTPESDSVGGKGSPWEIRIASKEISETESQSPVREPIDNGATQRTPDGNRADSEPENGTISATDGGSTERDGRTQSQRPDEVGGIDEQSAQFSGGDDTPRPDIRIKPIPSYQEQLNMLGEAEEVKPSAFSISQQVIDEVLTSGDNEIGTTLRIAAYFKKDHNNIDNADFLQREYRVGGKGFVFEGNRVSTWFDNAGIHIAIGNTVRTDDVTLVTWEQAAKRVRELLDLGRYMPQSELDKIDGQEFKDLAEKIWHLCRDRADDVTFSFMDEDLLKGGFPNSTARIAEILTDPVQRGIILAGLEEFAEMYERDNSLLRFRSAVRIMNEAISDLRDLKKEPLNFYANGDVIPLSPQFITQDEIDQMLRGGSSFSQGKFRIYSYFLQNRSPKENADFIKSEYGTSGSATNSISEKTTNSKGVTYSRRNGRISYDKVTLSWTQVSKRIDELIKENRYMSQSELDFIPQYEKEEIARQIHSFYYNQSETVVRPFPYGAEHSNAVNIISEQLDSKERIAEILSGMEEVLDNTADFDRNYDRMQNAFDNLTAYQNGIYTLFPNMKIVEQQISETTEQIEVPAIPPDTPVAVNIPDENTNYNLIIGTVVYIDDEEYEITFLGADTVVLQNVNMPLFIKEMPRDEVDLKLRGNRQNDRLIEQLTDSEAPLFSVVRENLQKHGISVSNDVVRGSVEEYHHQGGLGEDPTDIADFIEAELTAAYVIGDRFTQLNKLYEIERADETVSAREINHLLDETKPKYAHYSKDSFEEQIEIGGIVLENQMQTESVEQSEDSIIPAWEKPKSQSQSYAPYPDMPMSDRHNYRITNDDLGTGGQKAKFKNNIEAIKTLQKIESENRLATPEEQDVLINYVGWGGLQQAFDPDNTSWTKEYTELKTLLSDEEYNSARATTLNAHYTSPVVIKAIYKAIENMGFKTGNILDPGCGIGNFQGLLPDSMADSKIYGIEIDPITGRIAQQLYQKNNITIQGFENTSLPDSFFDLAIGNVPFGSYSVVDKKYDKHKFHIHDYFFAKTLDKVRPGGVVAFVTSRYTMDKKNPSVRKYIAQRADLLGAIRLPNNAFLENAGTEVTTDIIFLQKRDRLTDIEPDWVHLEKTEEGFAINSYFVKNPEMILGTMSNDSGLRMYASEKSFSCVPFPDSDLSEQLAEAVTNIHAEITEYEHDDDEQEFDNSIPADPSIRNFSYTVVDGQIYYRQDSRMVPVEMSVTAQNRVKGLIELRECARTVIMYQTDDYPDTAIKAEQGKLNRLYDNFSEKYGIINSRGNSVAFAQDSSYCLLCSLEILNEHRELERKADIFNKRTIRPHIPVTHVDTAVEALTVSMSEKAKVDLQLMSELTGSSENDIIKELEGIIFSTIKDGVDIGKNKTPEHHYVTAGEYLSGNIREKLKLAREAQATFPDKGYDVNVKALEAAMPPDLSAAEISVKLGATWLPEDVIQEFMYDLLQTPEWLRKNHIDVMYTQYTGQWSVKGKTVDRSNIHANNTYGTQRVSGYKIIEDSLNLRDVRVFDTVYEDGKEKRVFNKQQTAIAQAKQEVIRSKFEEWIWKDPDRRERLCQIYNERFNSIRPREYDGSHLTFPGMNPEIALRQHQVDAIARVLYGGNTLLAHEVGAGKTFEMIAAAMESKRLGLCNKSLIVVPNHITEQWAGEFLQLYPSANILVATRKDFEAKNRKKFCARIATGDYDAIIIGHSQFEKIPMSIQRQAEMINRQITDLINAIDETKRNQGERLTIKQLEKTKKALEVRLERLNDQSRKDNVVNFEELGIDRLFIDESHYYKNLYLYTKMRNVGGIAQVEAQKSSDLFLKTQYLDEITDGRGTVFATGTPISNSMVELYTIQRYLQYQSLVKNGLQHFDAWASTFGETVTAIELAPEGTGYRVKTRFAKFHNLPELMNMFKMVADIQTAEMLDLPVPKANFHTEVIKPSEWQKEMVAGLAERAEKIRDREVEPSEDNMLLVTNDGRKLALDQRLINPMLPDDPDGKVSICANNVYRIWEEHKDKRLTQLVFCDLSTPKNDGKFNVYNDLKIKLSFKGIPEDEIAFIHDANTEIQKRELFAKVRKGQIRVLIGSTQKMGSGTNIQDKLIALHDLCCPWRPSDLAQRLGRIVRQGNQNPEVEVFRYVTESTFDSYLYQLVENKQKFISQIMTSKLPVRSAEDVDETALSYAEIKALATGNPLIIEKCQLEVDVGKLKILHASHLNQKYSLEDKILKTYPLEIKRLTERIAGYKADIQTVKQNTPQNKETFPPMTIGGISYDKKADAGNAIIEACKAMTSPDPVQIGNYRGFTMELSYHTILSEYKITLQGSLTHEVPLGTDIHGNITRLDNKLEGLDNTLENCERKLADTQKQLENAKGEVDRVFPQEQELAEKSTRLKELNILLNMDEKDKVLLDVEPDDVDMKVAEKSRDYVR